MARLILQFGGQTLQVYPLDEKPVTIGRARECSLCIDNLGVSRNHSRIEKQGDTWVVTDQGSQNGTVVNGQMIRTHVLKHKDVIGVGKHTLLFEEKEEAEVKVADAAGGGLKAAVTGFDPTMAVDASQLKALQQRGIQKAAQAAGKRTFLWNVARGTTHDLVKTETVIGKGENCDIKIAGMFIGKWHAIINKISEDEFHITHLQGWRAVRVNRQRVHKHKLENRDIIQIGRNELQFIVSGPGGGGPRG